MPPVVSFVNPAQRPVSGGTTVVITGTGLTGATAVRFGAANAVSFTVTSATQITAVTPAGSAGPVAVTVTSPSGTSNATVTVTYTAVSLPTVTGLSPSSGSTSEAAPASGAAFVNSATLYRRAGYRVEVVVLAVRAADSLQGTAGVSPPRPGTTPTSPLCPTWSPPPSRPAWPTRSPCCGGTPPPSTATNAPPLPFSWPRNGVPGPRVRYGCVPPVEVDDLG
ncbi:IPT/TIG domain-containing protein, partial [Streptomyces sp. NPDC032161]|uniref:IPT/TIG domain-containing protein n=1 Tax=unclassified Streptomyces TaxID=2593676 RepID=UPI00340E5A24